MEKLITLTLGTAIALLGSNGCDDAHTDADADGWTSEAGDCDDANSAINPGAVEVCDAPAIDEDCDGLINDQDPSVAGAYIEFEDGDGDGFGDPTKGNISCEGGQGGVANGQDCDDANPFANPQQPGSCLGSGIVVLSPNGGSGEGYGFDSIQAALDDAALATTIYLEPGTYNVNLDLPRRDIHLVGTLGGQVTLDGSSCVMGDTRCSVIGAHWGESGGFMNTRAASLSALILTGGQGTAGMEIGQTATRTYGGGLALSEANPTLIDIEARANSAYRGGGIWMDHSQPRIDGLTLIDNDADSGGGAYIGFSASEWVDALVQGNRASTGGGISIDNSNGSFDATRVVGNNAEFGAGLNITLSSPAFTGLHVEGNTATDIGGGLYVYDSLATFNGLALIKNTAKSGAGLNLSYASTPITDLRAEGNVAEEYGGALYIYESQPIINSGEITNNRADVGGGIFISYAHPRLNNLWIEGNSSTSAGGGIYAASSRAQLKNVVLTDNDSGTRGGGLYESYSDLSLTNVTIAHNRANEGGGLFMHFESAPTLDSTIVAFNAATAGADNIFVHESSDPTLSYSLFFGAEGSGVEGADLNATCLSADPRFSDDLYHLDPQSPAVDAGQPAPAQADVDGTRNDMGVYGGPGGV